MENREFETIENNEILEEISEQIETDESVQKPKRKAKVVIIVVSIVLAVILALGATAAVLYYNGYLLSLKWFNAVFGEELDNNSDFVIPEWIYDDEINHQDENSSKKDKGNKSNSSGDKDSDKNKDNNTSNTDISQQTNTSSNNDNTSKPSNNSSVPKEDDKVNSKNLSLRPTVTIATQVASNLCVVGGSCSVNTEYITISGDGVDETKVIPFAGDGYNYFVAQVKYTKSTEFNITAKEKGKDTSKAVNRYISKAPMTDNYTTQGEYNAVFGKNSRMHFYSALLSYSLDTSKLTGDMKQQGRNNISKIVNAANQVGAETIFYIIPSSAEIYPETVPDEYKKASGQTLYKAFYDIATECGAKVMYPLDTMKAHANDGVGYQIYQYTDSHWSAYGAYWGMSDLFNYISQSFPNARPRTVAEMGFYTAELCGGDAFFNFPQNIGFENSIGEGTTLVTGIRELTTLYKRNMPTSTLSMIYHSNNGLYLTEDNGSAGVIINPNGAGLPTAVIMRDSFGKVAYDMINDRFSTVYWGAFNNYNIPYDFIAYGNPDYVIYLYSERNLLKIMMGTSYASILNIK